MSRTKLALTIAGTAVTAAAAGAAIGLLFAPASGREIRRRLASRAEDECRSAVRASGRMLKHVAARAKHELQSRAERIA
jgi:gas vesicle protein